MIIRAYINHINPISRTRKPGQKFNIPIQHPMLSHRTAPNTAAPDESAKLLSAAAVFSARRADFNDSLASPWENTRTVVVRAKRRIKRIPVDEGDGERTCVI